MRPTLIFLAMLVLSACSPPSAPTKPPPPPIQLTSWKSIPFELGGGAEATTDPDGTLHLGIGEPMAGVVLNQPDFTPPTGDYEIELEAKIVDGNDFFCGLTFPVPAQSSHCTLIVGGWGGTLVGLSSVNGNDASLNTTRHDRPFDPRRWYHIRVRVTADYIDVFIDREPVIELDIREKKIAMRPGAIERCKPIGLATWRTAAAYRNIRLRRLAR